MKKVLIPLLLLTMLFGCFDKDESGQYYSGEPVKFIEVIPGDCAIDGHPTTKSALFSTDTVIFTITGEELDIMVRFHATCCGEYNTLSKISNDSIIIDIATAVGGLCNCICDYQYNFKYSDFTHSYKCIITRDNNLFFNGLAEP